MANVEELLIKLTADNADLKKKLSDSGKDVSSLGGIVSKLGPMIAGAFTVGAVLSFAKAAYGAAEEQAKANRRLELAVKGNSAAFKELSAQAEKLRATTAVDDAAIMQIQGMGAAAGYSIDRIKKITEASVQLASVTGQDLQSAYMQVNTTLNGSAGRLTRLDGDFGKLTEAQLRNGDAIDLILKKYAGFAEESASATEKLKSNWDEFAETIGTSAAQVINPALEGISEWLQQINNKQGFWQKLLVTLGGGTTAGNMLSSSFNAMNLANDNAAKKTEKTTEQLKKFDDQQKKVNQSVKTFGSDSKSALDKYIEQMDEAYTKSKQWEEVGPFRMAFQQQTSTAIAPMQSKGAPALGISRTGLDALNGLTQSKTEKDKALEEKYTLFLKTEYGKRKAAVEKDLREGVISSKQAAAQLKAIDQDRTNAIVAMTADSLGQVAALFGENTLAYKTIASAQAIMNTYLSATAAYAAGLEVGGPAGLVLGPVMAGVAIAAGLANVAKINGAFAMGGIVGGSSYSGDSITARVNSGEMILNGRQQSELFALANGMGTRQQVEVVGYISGDVIRLANKRSTYMQNRIG